MSREATTRDVGGTGSSVQFRNPAATLGNLDTQMAADVIAAASDITLVIDADGVIVDLALGNDPAKGDDDWDWVGSKWIDTVTVESREKVEQLLADALARRDGHARQVNHPSSDGPDIPVQYSAFCVDEGGPVIAIGRDMRTMADLQRRLVDVQLSMEREYSRLRHVETRYRVLFQLATESVLIAECSSRKIIDANPAASKMLGRPVDRIVGRQIEEIFESEQFGAVDTLLAAVRAGKSVGEVRSSLVDGRGEFSVSASLFRHENSSCFLVRLSPLTNESLATPTTRTDATLLRVVESLPDGFVVTDTEGRILTANNSFLESVQLATLEQALGESLERWLGRPGIDLAILTANLREHHTVPRFGTILRGEFGSVCEVEVSAVEVGDADQLCFGFAVFNADRRPTATATATQVLPHPVENLAHLVGRTSMKDIVRDATDIIEKLCIEAALELTGNNRASAAEILGLSRQSLYMKLKRHGIGDSDRDDDIVVKN